MCVFLLCVSPHCSWQAATKLMIAEPTQTSMRRMGGISQLRQINLWQRSPLWILVSRELCFTQKISKSDVCIFTNLTLTGPMDELHFWGMLHILCCLIKRRVTVKPLKMPRLWVSYSQNSTSTERQVKIWKALLQKRSEDTKTSG